MQGASLQQRPDGPAVQPAPHLPTARAADEPESNRNQIFFLRVEAGPGPLGGRGPRMQTPTTREAAAREPLAPRRPATLGAELCAELQGSALSASKAQPSSCRRTGAGPQSSFRRGRGSAQTPGPARDGHGFKRGYPGPAGPFQLETWPGSLGPGRTAGARRVRGAGGGSAAAASCLPAGGHRPPARPCRNPARPYHRDRSGPTEIPGRTEEATPLLHPLAPLRAVRVG